MRQSHHQVSGWYIFHLFKLLRRHSVRALTITCVALVFCEKTVAGSADPDWPMDLIFIQKNLDRRDCDEAGKLIWKHMRRGNREAFLSAGGAMLGAGLKFPGIPTDGLYLNRLLATAVFHGYNPVRPLLAQMTAQCSTKPDRDLAECVQLTHDRKILPAADEIVAELKFYMDAASNMSFVCLAYTK
jgi:hypothetical protein